MGVAFEDQSATNVSEDTSRTEEPSIRNVADYRNGIKRALTGDTSYSHSRSTRDQSGSRAPLSSDEGRSDGATSGRRQRGRSRGSRATTPSRVSGKSKASEYSRSASPRLSFNERQESRSPERRLPSALKTPKNAFSVNSAHLESPGDSAVESDLDPEGENPEETEKPAEETDTPNPTHSRWSSFRKTASKYTIGTLGVTGGLGFVYSTLLPSTCRSTIASDFSSAFRSVRSGISSAWNNPSSAPSNATGAFSSMVASAWSEIGTGVSYVTSATGNLPWWAQTGLATLGMLGTAAVATTGYREWKKGKSTAAAKIDVGSEMPSGKEESSEIGGTQGDKPQLAYGESLPDKSTVGG